MTILPATWRAAAYGHRPRWSLPQQVPINGRHIIDCGGIGVLRRHAIVDGQRLHPGPKGNNEGTILRR